jgi:hypothetical protein
MRQDAMTTEHDMLTDRRRRAAVRVLCAFGLVIAFVITLSGCAGEQLHAPRSLSSPYPASSGEFLWAVAPVANESGTSDADPLLVSDSLVAQVQQIHGLNAIPVNRVLEVMRSLEIEVIDSPAAAVQVAKALGADAVVAGTITAWDPYEPPEIGLAISLFVLRDEMRSPGARSPGVDPRALQAAPTDYTLPTRASPTTPVSSVSEHLDAANHEVLMRLRDYADGRHDPDAPMGWRRYAASMSLFTEFACHRLTERLLDAERIRVARALADAE